MVISLVELSFLFNSEITVFPRYLYNNQRSLDLPRLIINPSYGPNSYWCTCTICLTYKHGSVCMYVCACTAINCEEKHLTSLQCTWQWVYNIIQFSQEIKKHLTSPSDSEYLTCMLWLIISMQIIIAKDVCFTKVNLWFGNHLFMMVEQTDGQTKHR